MKFAKESNGKVGLAFEIDFQCRRVFHRLNDTYEYQFSKISKVFRFFTLYRYFLVSSLEFSQELQIMIIHHRYRKLGR